MLTVTPFHPGDADQALRLFDWIRDLGGAKGHRLILVADTRCDPQITKPIADSAKESFDSVEVLPFTDHFKKWPEAPNAAFAFVARHIMSAGAANGRAPWLLLEPDCAPLRAGWLDLIENEYLAAGKPFMGAKVEVENVPLHMSGNGCYPADMIAHAGLALIANDIAWDVAAANQIVPQAHFTKLIEHAWKHPTFESFEQIEREVSKDAVLYHASKDGSLIRLLRERKNDLSGGDLIAGRRDAAPMGIIDQEGGMVSEVGSGIDYPIRNGAQAPSTARESRDNVTGLAAPFLCDILIKSYPPDYERLRYCLRSIEKFASGFRRAIVVIPAEPEVHDFGMGMSNPECFTITVTEHGEGYLFQQTIKASAHEYTDADYILHLDSDTILTRPITPETFFRDGKPLWLITPYTHIQAGIDAQKATDPSFHCGAMTWKAVTEKFLAQPVEYEFMRRMPMFVPRFLHVAAAAFCKLQHGISLADYIMAQPAKEFSEFNALGALAYSRARDDFSWLDTTLEPLPEPVAIQKWSHEPFSDETKAEFEAILSRPDADDGPRPPITRDDGPMEIKGGESTPWESQDQSIAEIKNLAERLQQFCTGGARTRRVRDELHKLGVVQLAYRFKRRKKWRKRKAKT